MVTAMRRCACMLALVLLFLAAGVGGVPEYGIAPEEAAPLKLFPLDYGWTLEAGVAPASADMLSDANQEPGSYEGTLSRPRRFKTH